MRLYALAIKYGDNNRYCGVYPTLNSLRDYIKEMSEDSWGMIEEDEIPTLCFIRSEMSAHVDFFYEFKNETQMHIQEVSGELVGNIIKFYHLERGCGRFIADGYSYKEDRKEVVQHVRGN